jgi:2-iminobutanoate/2-iminopropanoate deaminase
MTPHKPLVPAGGAKPVGPYIPGIEAGQYVYASGQGASDSAGHRAPDIESQTRQAILNCRVILEAAGLGLADVVQVQFFLLDLKNLPAADRVYHEYFGSAAPPRVILGTARMPTDTPVEITVVAHKGGGHRVYLPPVYAKSAAEAEHDFQALLNHSPVLQRVEYSTSDWKPGVVSIDALPDGATHAILGIIGEDKTATFCPVVASDPHGTVEEQTRSAFRQLEACLKSKGFGLADITATNVYLDNMDDFAKMNAVYAEFFPESKPTRTTVQPYKTAGLGSLVRISAFAVK